MTVSHSESKQNDIKTILKEVKIREKVVFIYNIYTGQKTQLWRKLEETLIACVF